MTHERNPAPPVSTPRRRLAPALLRLAAALGLLGATALAQAQTVCPGLVVTPANSTVLITTNVFYDATFSVSNGNGGCTVTDVTTQALWTSSAPATAAFLNPNTPYEATAQAAGTTTITASYTVPGAGTFTANTPLTVNPPLGAMAGLTPNQKSVGQALDTVCPRLAAIYNSDNPPPPEPAALLGHCNGILLDPNPVTRAAALSAIGGQDFTSFQSQTLMFAQSHTANVLDRMMALRSGARGLNVADLTLDTANGPVSLAELFGIARDALGGGASADAAPDGLLSDKLGLWLRGTYGKGSKSASTADNGFDGHQVTATFGGDYRVGSQSVLGLAFSLARAGIGFRTVGGGLDTHAFNGSLYGSGYLYKNLYVDGLVNYGHDSYTTTRHIVYVESGSTVDETAVGETTGGTWNGTLSFGYDVALGGLTVTPMVGYAYLRSTISSFTETGATGLNLSIDEQTIKSSTANVGLQMNLAWNTAIGVILPHLRAQWIHEFDSAAPLLGMHFAADPLGGTDAQIIVQGDPPNSSYWKLAGGASVQFKHGVAGYIEYQRLQGYGAGSYGDLTAGLRVQTHF